MFFSQSFFQSFFVMFLLKETLLVLGTRRSKNMRVRGKPDIICTAVHPLQIACKFNSGQSKILTMIDFEEAKAYHRF
jgi:hypothetical protein